MVDFRVPDKGDLYIDKNGLLHRCKANNWSRRSQRRIIVKETWATTPWKPKPQRVSGPRDLV